MRLDVLMFLSLECERLNFKRTKQNKTKKRKKFLNSKSF